MLERTVGSTNKGRHVLYEQTEKPNEAKGKRKTHACSPKNGGRATPFASLRAQSIHEVQHGQEISPNAIKMFALFIS